MENRLAMNRKEQLEKELAEQEAELNSRADAVLDKKGQKPHFPLSYYLQDTPNGLPPLGIIPLGGGKYIVITANQFRPDDDPFRDWEHNLQ